MEGGAASAEFYLLFQKIDEMVAAKNRVDLLEYFRLETMVMVEF